MRSWGRHAAGDRLLGVFSGFGAGVVSARYNTDTLESSFWTAEIHIVVDGEIYSASNLNRSDGGAVLRAHVGIDDIVPLSAGQELHIAAWQNRNANHTLHGDPLFVFVAISEIQ